jgi:hypothetical protein
MTYFLERISEHLYNEYSDRLNKHCLVFPNRRAGLYFLKYLSSSAGKPLWAPPVKTINELFTSYSSLKLAENEILIFELYRVYKKLNAKAGSFDEFYFWGDMLLSDFDDVDKYMVDASKLFSNLSDLKTIDREFGTMSPEQIGVIRKFWVNFNVDSITDQKADFLSLWSVLAQLYHEFRNELRNKGLAYEGMIFRDLAEMCREGSLPAINSECFHFIGFNALNTCEKILMGSLKMAGKAKFYWDFDNSFVTERSNHSAGFFIKTNLKDFGNDMPPDWNYDSINSEKPQKTKLRIIDTSSDIAQVKLVSRLLDEMSETSGPEAHHTAVVLSDENLLVPLLSGIPENINAVNVTMGYPLKFSPVYSLIKQLLTLQNNSVISGTEELFDHKDVLNLLKHNYFADNAAGQEIISGIMKEKNQWIPSQKFTDLEPFNVIFKRALSPALLSGYLKTIIESLFITDNESEEGKRHSTTEINIRNEFIYRTLLALNRLETTITGAEVILSVATYSRLLDKVLRGLAIPFSGEPLNGIQIMGILETRSLDFKNLIILSVNEGILPRTSAGSSYIPYNLREAFGLPTIRHQDSIYSYYFYRLLQRAENVTFLYNSNSEGLKTGEMSRFLLQLKFLTGNPPGFLSLGYDIRSGNRIEETIQKTDSHIGRLKELFFEQSGKILSPSAVNTWLSCRMKFYYKYLCGLREPETIVTEIDHALFGGMLHSIMEKVLTPCKGIVLDSTGLKKLMENKRETERIISEIIIASCHGGRKTELTGNDQIISNILNTYVNMILRFDNTVEPVTVKELEKSIASVLEIGFKNGKASVSAGGIIDRLDFTGGTHRIVDYKTGGITMEIGSVSSLFDEEDEKRNEAWFQILMYCELFSRNNPSVRVRPALYALRSMSASGFSDHLVIKNGKDSIITVDDYQLIKAEYSSLLISAIEKIFSLEEPFVMTGNLRKCEYCPFTQLCRR